MTTENEQHLRAKHPDLFAKPTGGVASVRFAVDGFAVDDGWLAILDEMAAEIEQTCAETGNKLPTVLQITEKFGLLRVYLGGASDAVDAIMALAEARSAVTCEDCGVPGRLRRRNGWMRTLCNEHDAASRRG
jgi:hypothetical protein